MGATPWMGHSKGTSKQQCMGVNLGPALTCICQEAALLRL